MTCATCTNIDTNLSNVANGKLLGVSEATIRRHLQHKDQNKTDSFFTDVPVEFITSRGKSVRLPDGSWEKISFAPNAMALREALSYDDLERALEGFVAVDPPTKSTGHTATLHAADLQIGKANQRGGGTPETLARSMQSFKRFVLLCQERKPEHIILSDNGDCIENVFNVPSQLVTNDLDVPAQIRTFRRLMIEGMKLLAPLAPQITYVSVPSNHGAFRTGYKSQGGTVDADFGLDISYQLEDVLAGRDGFEHVGFVRPDTLEETAVIESSGTRLAYHHGHQSAGPNAHGKWWSNQDHGRRPGWDADILAVAHFHSMRVEHSGNGRWIIGVSSSDAQSDWFTNRTGESAIQGMTTFDVKDGQWSNLAII